MTPGHREPAYGHADDAKAMLNVLEDFAAEKEHLELTQHAMMNLLEDIDAERKKVVDTAAELARSNSDLEQFAHVVSHDLQEPLRMVSSYVQRLATRYEGQLDAQADKYIRYAVEGALRMEALIDGLLEYSRVSRREIQLSAIDADAALEQALSSLKRAIGDAGAVVTHDPLPRVRADLTQLGRVFQNLVANAVKFHRADVHPVVHVSGRRRGDLCEFAVKDNGIGIDPQHFERIFVIFQRVGEPARYPGTGLGLAICKKVIERHGGRIWVESSPGQGATFRFTMPAPRP